MPPGVRRAAWAEGPLGLPPPAGRQPFIYISNFLPITPCKPAIKQLYSPLNHLKGGLNAQHESKE